MLTTVIALASSLGIAAPSSFSESLELLPASDASEDFTHPAALDNESGDADSALEENRGSPAESSIQAFSTQAQKLPFLDISKGHQFYDEISWMYSSGLTTGSSTPEGLKFYPRASLTREAMAAFMFRQFGDPSYEAPKDSPFIDISTGHKFYREIAWMHDAGVSTGWRVKSGSQYRAKDRIKRDAMAAFLYRQLEDNPNTWQPETFPFTDIDTQVLYHREIRWMYETGRSTGYYASSSGTRSFDPYANISREATAAFFARAVSPVDPPKLPTIPHGTITMSGSAVEGRTLTAEVSRWDVPGLSYAYQWFRDDAPIPHATQRSYTTVQADTGKNLSVGVTVSAAGYAPTLKKSTSRTVAPPVIAPGTISISGTLKSGNTLTARTAGWSPSDLTFTYQWTRDGVNISGARQSTYRLTNSDAKSTIRVTATASKQGYRAVAKTSSAVRIATTPTPAPGFTPGYIISDSNMYDGDAMTVDEIQAFLEKQLPSCRIGSPGYEAGKKYGNTAIASHCLPQMKFDSHSDPANAQCRTYTGKKGESAAEIIYRVAQACDLSPKVILTTLQKEQSLITDTWPTVRQYDIAMGYGCPDTGPNYSANCNPTYVGFYEQVSWMAWQFKYYKDNPGRYNFRASQSTNIQYHPNPACGTQHVTIENAATAGLYNYTPYVPNQASLNAGVGTGNSCSSYGNRNFYHFFNLWFGTPR